MVPAWLHQLSIIIVVAGFVCFAVIAIDVARHPQKMWIMNVVWPVAALFGTALAILGYFNHGRRDDGRLRDELPDELVAASDWREGKAVMARLDRAIQKKTGSALAVLCFGRR